MTNLTGSDLYTAVTNLLGGFQMNTTLFYQLLNVARVRRESMRPFLRLQKMDNSQVASPLNSAPLIPQSQQAFTIPSDFLYMREDGFLSLYNNNNIWQNYFEIPLGLAIFSLQTNNTFYFDHANNKYYLTGIIDLAYTIYMYYQADWGDITSTTTWVNIPGLYHMILAFDVAAMYRLGVDYDDINARNADNNNQQAEMLFNAMCRWDDNLARSSVTRLDYPTPPDAPGFTNRKIDINS